MKPPIVPPLNQWLSASGLIMLALSAVVVAGVARGAEALYLEYSVTSDVIQATPPKGAMRVRQDDKAQTAEPKESRHTMKVCLAGSCFSIDYSKGQTVYDFETGRIRYFNSKTATWSDASLYSQIGFRVMEYQNRMFLGGVLAASGVQGPMSEHDEFTVQTLFGIKLPKKERRQSDDSAVKKTTRGGFDIFSHKGEECVRVKYSEHAIPEALRRVFERFLVYGFNIHPDVRREIIKSGKVPVEMTLKWDNIGENTRNGYTLAVVRVGDAPEKWPGANEPMVDFGDDEMKAAFAAARDEMRFAQRKTVRQTRDYVDSRMAAGMPLDAILAAMEYGLQTGEQSEIGKFISKHRDKMSADSQCLLYFASIVPNSSKQEQIKAALDSLGKINRQGVEKAHVLDIQRGDLLMFLGRGGEARAAFLDALKNNPFIAGVWKDLGDLHYNGYKMALAWACWDTARRLYPNHSMLQEVAGLELKLKTDFPEFFLP